MSNGLNKDKITPAFLRANDGKVVWIQDDYLSMRDYACNDPELYVFLEHVYEVKQQCRERGMVFKY